MQGVVREGGLVFVHGELWRARADEPLRLGQRVAVDRLDGLDARGSSALIGCRIAA